MIEAKVFCCGDDINTDLIYPARYTYILMTEEEMASHAMEDLDPEFSKLETGEYVIVAGKNFGCGSAREQAVKALKSKGVKAIIARSFSRIYYRNCINEGILPIISPGVSAAAKTGDVIRIDTDQSTICLEGQQYSFPAFPDYVKKIISAGGIIASVRQAFQKEEGLS